VSLSDPLRVVRKVTDAFEALGIRYLVGGSLASSLHGIPRATQDIDVIAEITGQHIAALEKKLSTDFYFNAGMALEAVKQRSSFNIIDREQLFKADIFVLSPDELSAAEMDRRVRHRIADSDGGSIYVCSPEDIVAHKLYWFKLGEGVSDRQWNDAVNVIKIQGNRLDLDYCRKTCRARGVSELLEKALKEAGEACS
jgi:hypothetical protein